MDFLTQSRLHDPDNGVRGTCLRTCIAMVIGSHESAIPLRYLEVEGWWEALEEDLARMGWRIHYVPIPYLVEPSGWHVMNGPGPRGFPHSCLGYRGELIWDPHPSRDGLLTVSSYYILEPIRS